MILDIGLPGEDGYSLIARMRELEAAQGLSRVPAIALTAFARTHDCERLRRDRLDAIGADVMNPALSTSTPLPPKTQRFVHDLRNCLASMRAGTSVLRRSATQPAIVEKVADNMDQQVQEMLSLVDEFIGRPLRAEHSAPPEAPQPHAECD